MVDLTQMTDEQVVVHAIACRVQAESAEGEAGSNPRWGAADAYASLYDAARGWRQPQIAQACGVSQITVSRHIRISSHYGLDIHRPPFWEAYKAVVNTGTTTHQRMGRRPALDDSQITEARTRRAATGASIRVIAADFGVSPATLQKALAVIVPATNQTKRERDQAERARQAAVTAVASFVNTMRGFAATYLMGQSMSDLGVLATYGDSVIVEALGQNPEIKEHLGRCKDFLADVIRLYGSSQIHVLQDQDAATG